MSFIVLLGIAGMGCFFSAVFALICILDLRALRRQARDAERRDRVLRRVELWSLTEFDRERYIAEVEDFLAGQR